MKGPSMNPTPPTKHRRDAIQTLSSIAGMLLQPFALTVCSLGAASAENSHEGYPKPVSFRQITPELVLKYDWIQMVVSDMHVHTRRDAVARFKERFPDRPALVQINCEGLGLWGSWESVPRQRFDDLGILDPGLAEKAPVLEIFSSGIYPLPDFLGYWTYDAGARTAGSHPRQPRGGHAARQRRGGVSTE